MGIHSLLDVQGWVHLPGVLVGLQDSTSGGNRELLIAGAASIHQGVLFGTILCLNANG